MVLRNLQLLLALTLAGCSPPTPASNKSTSVSETEPNPITSNSQMAHSFPILKIHRSAGDDVFLSYKLTDAERSLFKQMDAVVVALGPDADLDQCHKAVVPIGQRSGLNPQQAIAFWTRTTFSTFEPE